MITHYCLNKKELTELILSRVGNIAIDDEELSLRVKTAELWQDELSSLTYLLSHIVEGYKKKGRDYVEVLVAFYSLEEEMFFSVQECDHRFVTYMLRNTRDPSLSLEEELVNLQVGISEHSYARTLRY
jgi:hypothetical protein